VLSALRLEGVTHQPYPQQYQQPYAYPQQPQYGHYPPQYYAQQAPAGPVFQVEVHQHTGLLLAFQSQERRFAGTYEQCLAELKRAQIHNLTAGWWSITSILILNWLALGQNRLSKRKLRREAIQAGVIPPPR
jgi:hypothetical protein